MCLKALELGYKWDISKYPTPAWMITQVNRMEYHYPIFSIPTHAWNRELRLWQGDCVERVLPVWDNWARIHRPKYTNIVSTAIQLSEEYSHGRISGEILDKHSIYMTNAYPENEWLSESSNISLIFSAAHRLLIEKYYADITANMARRASSDCHSEREWQREAFAKRIDKIAPWGI